jgi:hypothetical protein
MNVSRQNLTVASGATVSTHFVGSGFSSFGLITPSGLDGTAVTFEVGYYSDATITWTPLNNLATAVSLTVAASKAYKLPDDLRPFSEWRMITAAQTGAAVFTVFGKSEA